MKNLTRRTFLKSILGGLATIPFIGWFGTEQKKEWTEVPVDAVNSQAIATGTVFGETNEIARKRWAEAIYKESQTKSYFGGMLR